jgi:tRNA 2-thiouridine synthesizing protein A
VATRALSWTASARAASSRDPELPSMGDASRFETVLDLRGLNCPQPVLRAKKALRAVPIGGTLVLECTDPLTVIDVPHFVNQTGHALQAQERRGTLYLFRIIKRK